MHTIGEWRGNVYHAGKGDDFFQSSKWRKLRRAVFYRDVFCCLRCGRRLRMDKLTAHHMIHRSEGGPDEMTNLVTLCAPCHDFVEIQGYRTGSAIVGSMPGVVIADEVDDETVDPDDIQPDDEFKRPIWHTWVYGGKRHHL